MSVSRGTIIDIESLVSRETLEKLRAYERLVIKWNKTINLIGRADAKEFWPRHILDCLQLKPLIPKNAKTAIDLGSGAGLPGLIIALSTDLHMTLIEADQRKVAFLRMATIALNIKADILAQRIEVSDIKSTPLIMARALAPLPELLKLAVPKLEKNGTCLFMKGKNSETELTLAQNQWQMKVERFSSQTSPTATILKLSEICRAPSGCKQNFKT